MKVKPNDIYGDSNIDIESITDKAKLQIENVKYDLGNKTVKIPIKRYKIKDYKKGIISRFKKPVYDKNQIIYSEIIVGNVENYEVKNICDEEQKEVTILFGVQLKENEIYISSAEENQGENIYEITITTSCLNIEIIDL